MMDSVLLLLAAVAAGWVVQIFMTLRQSTAFNKRVVALRSQGIVVVGVAGNRYRGGRAYLALAAEDGTVRDAISLQGWTTLAKGRTVPALRGVAVSTVEGETEIPGLTRQQRAAARLAVQSLRESTLTADGRGTPSTP